MRKILCALLAFILLIALSVPAFAAEAPGYVYPTVYICGRIFGLYNDLGTEDEFCVYDSDRVRSKEVPDVSAYAKEQAKALLPEFAKALFTGNYDEWAADFSGVLQPIYSDFVLDKSGTPPQGSGVKETFDRQPDLAQADGTYPLPEGLTTGRKLDYIYEFPWDWRLSPLDVADSLRTYIDHVLEITGKTKVHLISRCEGCCVATAYFAKYGSEDKIATNVFLGSSANGVGYISNIFAGKYEIDAEALTRYIGRNFATGSDKSFGDDWISDEFLRTYLRESICLLSASHSLDLLTGLLVKMVNKVSPMVYPGLLMTSYGTCPGFWAMVRHEDYEDAKALAGLNGNEEWADFVALIDDYHYNVQQKADEILKGLQARGCNTAIICKYGAETLPFVEVSNELNDDTALVKDSSYGATTAKIGSPFSDAYINAAAAAGKSAYLSPDRMIDASTCLFPETTWFIKNQSHNSWENIMLVIYRAFIRSNGTLKIGDENGFGRFYIMTDESQQAEIMTAENAGGSASYPADLRSVLRNWFAALKALLQHLPELLAAKVAAI